MTISPGTRLGPFHVVDLIGVGGMGAVYRAHDPRLRRDVAIKVLPPGFLGDANRLRRFEQEALAVARLAHPNIVAVHDVGSSEGSPYIVTELLEGSTLREKMNGRPLPVQKAVAYATQICHALAAAHDRGIVHRDIKPENVFVTREGRIKILDFGIARLTDGEEATAETAVTLTGSDRSEPPRIWRRSRRAVHAPTIAPTFSAWALCCTRWCLGFRPFDAKRLRKR